MLNYFWGENPVKSKKSLLCEKNGCEGKMQN